jgi:hypothetical protein
MGFRQKVKCPCGCGSKLVPGDARVAEISMTIRRGLAVALRLREVAEKEDDDRLAASVPQDFLDLGAQLAYATLSFAHGNTLARKLAPRRTVHRWISEAEGLMAIRKSCPPSWFEDWEAQGRPGAEVDPFTPTDGTGFTALMPSRDVVAHLRSMGARTVNTYP